MGLCLHDGGQMVRPDIADQTELGVIGDADGILDIIKRQEGGEGAKYFLLRTAIGI